MKTIYKIIAFEILVGIMALCSSDKLFINLGVMLAVNIFFVLLLFIFRTDKVVSHTSEEYYNRDRLFERKTKV